MKRTIPLLLALLALTATTEARRKSCGSASCPLNLHQTLSAGSLRLGLSQEYIDQERIFVGSGRSFVGAIPGDHDEVRTVNRRTLARLEAGISDRLAVTLDVPFVQREHSHIDHPNGGAGVQNWNFSGLGDIVVAAEYAILDDEAFFSVGVGVKTSTGVTGAANSAGEVAEVTIQPGTGSVDALLRVNFSAPVATVPTLDGLYVSLPLNAGLSYEAAGRGTDDYRFGNTFLAHVGTTYGVSRPVDLLLQANLRLQGYADPGRTGEPLGNTGGAWLFLSPGVGLRFTDAVAVNAYIQFPVYQDVNGIQQTAAYNLSMNLSYSVNILE